MDFFLSWVQLLLCDLSKMVIMKKIIFIIFSLTIFSASIGQEISSIEELSQKFLLAVKEQSQEKLIKLIPLKEDMVQYIPGEDLGDEEKKELQEEIASTYDSKFKGVIIYNFNRVIKQGNEEGINWREVKYEKSIYNIEYDKHIEIANDRIIFSYKDSLYSIQINCAKIKISWGLGPDIKWKGEYVEE